MAHHLAQYNVGRVVQPLGHEEMAEFERALEPINMLAERAPGFVWRLTDDDGRSSSYVEVGGVEDPYVIVNYSIWEDLDSLRHFVYQSGHTAYLRRRREWFAPSEEKSAVCWWVPAGTIPPVEEAHRRLMKLRREGPSDEAWPLSSPRLPPG